MEVTDNMINVALKAVSPEMASLNPQLYMRVVLEAVFDSMEKDALKQALCTCIKAGCTKFHKHPELTTEPDNKEPKARCWPQCLCKDDVCMQCGRHYPSKPKEKTPTLIEYTESRKNWKYLDVMTPTELIKLKSEYLDKYMMRKE